MTTLASTAGHLVEFEARILTIARRTDGHCLATAAPGIAAQFRSCVKSHDAERATATFIRIALSAGATWKPLYKPKCMPR